MAEGSCIRRRSDRRVVDRLSHATLGMHHSTFSRHRRTNTPRRIGAARALRLLISYRRRKIDFEIRLLYTDRILLARWLDLQHCDLVGCVIVEEGEDVTERLAGKSAEGCLQHCLRVGDLKEVGILWLELDELSRWKIGRLGLQ